MLKTKMSSESSTIDFTNQNIFGIPYHKLYIRNLTKYTTEEHLREIFSSYGPIQILIGKGPLRGKAFITFISIEKATQALKEKHLTECNGKQLKIAYARSKEPTNFIPSNVSIDIDLNRVEDLRRRTNIDLNRIVEINNNRNILILQGAVQTTNPRRTFLYVPNSTNDTNDTNDTTEI